MSEWDRHMLNLRAVCLKMPDERHSVWLFHPRAGSKRSGSKRNCGTFDGITGSFRRCSWWELSGSDCGPHSRAVVRNTTVTNPNPTQCHTLYVWWDARRKKKNMFNLTFDPLQVCFRAIHNCKFHANMVNVLLKTHQEETVLFLYSLRATNDTEKCEIWLIFCFWLLIFGYILVACFHRLVMITQSFPQMQRWLR